MTISFRVHSMAWRLLLAGSLTVAALQGAQAQQRDHIVRTYKWIGGDSLVVHIFTPPAPAAARPAVVLFHGGGHVWGGPKITDASARAYAARGLVAFSVQYRLANRTTVTPIEQVEDASDLIRWVRTNAAQFGVDPNRVVAHGVSAGGFLAAMAAGSADETARSNALVLWSPGIGTDKDPYFRGLFGNRTVPRDFAPTHRIRPPMPPVIMISGALDSVTFESDAHRYCAGLQDTGGRCDFHSYPHLGHTLSRRTDARSQREGRFDWDPVAESDATTKVMAFLVSLGYTR